MMKSKNTRGRKNCESGGREEGEKASGKTEDYLAVGLSAKSAGTERWIFASSSLVVELRNLALLLWRLPANCTHT